MPENDGRINAVWESITDYFYSYNNWIDFAVFGS